MMNKPRKPTVLVVDDDGGIRSLLTLVLKAEGYEVLAAANGAEAFTLLHANEFNLAMLDYQLPDTDGLKILEEAKKTDSLLPVIMMSGMATVKLAVAGRASPDPLSGLAEIEASLYSREGALCRRCHEKDAAKPKGFPQVETVAHSQGMPCNTCHQPHSPHL